MKRAADGTVVRRAPQRRSDAFWTDSLKPEYYFEKGLRKIRPYFFEYRTFVKQRWLKRTLFDVFRAEFRDRPPEYYKEAVERGLITVDGAQVGLDHVLRDNQVICHKIHRHEPPISGEPLEILFRSDQMLVVNKPASMPVHPSGRYKFNSLVEILKHEGGFAHVAIVNRLDRLTSGIVVLGVEKNPTVNLHMKMEAGDFRKTYVCRVQGRFPAEALCQAPLLHVEHKLGLMAVSADGKASETRFTLMEYSAALDQSVVKAEPITGRTHQIRVHLLSLGHPIVNDHLYNNPAWDRVYTQNGATLSQAALKGVADELMATTFFDEVPDLGPAEGDAASLCPECDSPKQDPEPETMCIYLHAYRYACSEFDHQTALPAWAEF